MQILWEMQSLKTQNIFESVTTFLSTAFLEWRVICELLQKMEVQHSKTSVYRKLMQKWCSGIENNAFYVNSPLDGYKMYF